MGEIVRFHAFTSAAKGAAGAVAAKASKVMSRQPFSPASRTISDHLRGGMPRVRQVLTVEAGKPRASETAPVPPRSLITASGVINGNIVRSLRTSQGFATCETTFLMPCARIRPMGDALLRQAQRLIATRKALGFATQTAFCAQIGVKKNVYNPFERGKRPITLGVARKIQNRFGIPLDWTLDGAGAQKLPADIYPQLSHLAA